jgi:polyphosphate kinase
VATNHEGSSSAVSAANPDTYLNRELSLLAFNERVLAMATREDVPLAERLRYICIVSSNMDEFFEVRLSDLTEDVRTDRTGPSAGVERIASSAGSTACSTKSSCRHSSNAASSS